MSYIASQRSAVALLLALCSWLAAAATAAPNLQGPAEFSPAVGSPLVVQTEQGLVRGSLIGNVQRFAGVRFAAPPVGDLRWRAPQPPAPHSGIQDATQFGSQCPQATGAGTDPNEGGQEDCLFLNIYTPDQRHDARLRPVMVYIHGGSFITGAGANYVPLSMVTQGDVVVVTINYRLGPLGALALPELDAESPTTGSGTYALQDQQAALRWVRDNIARFGGNPLSVTVFGESAGATYTCLHLASPRSAGLYRSAIAESGCGLPSTTKSVAEQFGRSIAQTLGCTSGDATDIACLRAKTPLEVTRAAIAAAGGSAAGVQLASIPSTGGPVLPRSLYTALQSGQFNRASILLGTNRDEGRAFVFGQAFGPVPTDEASYLASLPTVVSSLGVSVAAVAAEYPLAQYSSAGEALSVVITDSSFACRTLKAARLAHSYVPLFAYEFTDENAPPVTGPPLGATHGSELPYLFDFGVTFTPDEQKLSRQMIGYWTAFAQIEQPNRWKLPPWVPFVSNLGPMQNLAPNALQPFSAEDFATLHHCAFWDTKLL